MRLSSTTVFVAVAFALRAAMPAAPALAHPHYETVIISESPVEAAGERRIDAATIATTPHASTDDLLRLVPGLLVSRHGADGKGRQIFVRGFDAVHGADLEVTVEGVPWNEASNVHGQGYLDFGTLIPEALVAIDADKGAHRLEQGPFATAGSLRFSLGIAPEARGVRLGYELGAVTGRHRVVGTAASRAGDAFVAVEGLHDRGYGTNRDTERLAALAGATVIDTGRHQLRVFGGAHTSRFGEPGTVPLWMYQSGRLGFHDSLSPDTRAHSSRAFLAGRWQMNGDLSRASTSLLVHAQARRLALTENFTGFLFDAQQGDRLAQRHQAAKVGARLVHRQPLALTLELLGGLDAAVEWLDQHEDRLDAALSPIERTRSLGGVQSGAGAHGGVRWMPRPWLRVEGGARVEVQRFDVDDRTAAATAATPGATIGPALLPRLQAHFYPHDGVTLMAAYGRGLRPPEARAAVPGAASAPPDQDLSRYRGGPPRATVADGIEVGARWHPVDSLDLGVGGFGTRIAREQLFDHVSGTNLELNATRRAGVELDLTVRPTSWLTLRTDLTAVDARFIDSGRPVPGAPRLLGTAEAHLAHPRGWSGGARLTALGPRPLAHGARAGAVAVADLMAEYRRGWWAVSLEIDNVLDVLWREGEFNYASWFDRAEPRSALPRIHYAAGPPRTVRAGVTARF